MDFEAFTINQFCAAENISRSLYYKLKAAGKGPREMHLGAAVRISKEARADWRREREAEASAADEKRAA